MLVWGKKIEQNPKAPTNYQGINISCYSSRRFLPFSSYSFNWLYDAGLLGTFRYAL